MKYLLSVWCLLLIACTNKPECASYAGHHTAPVVLRIHESFPSTYVNTLHMAADVWNAAARKDVFLIGGSYKFAQLQDGVHTLSFPDVWTDKPEVQARTYLRIYESRIVDADILINKNNSFAIDGTPPNNRQLSLQALLIHELGHVLGLEHEPGTVMNPTLAWGENRITLTQKDIDRLHCYY